MICSRTAQETSGGAGNGNPARAASFPPFPSNPPTAFPLRSVIARQDLDDQMLVDNVAQMIQYCFRSTNYTLPWFKGQILFQCRPVAGIPSSGGGRQPEKQSCTLENFHSQALLQKTKTNMQFRAFFSHLRKPARLSTRLALKGTSERFTQNSGETFPYQAACTFWGAAAVFLP